jgi:hypothetical protein
VGIIPRKVRPVDGWQIGLLISAIFFAGFLVWRTRPAVSAASRATAAELTEAKKRVANAKDDAERARALADAGDACARLGRMTGAAGFYRRALRADPRSKELVERAAAALRRRPRALEDILWRHLGAEPWSDGAARDAAIASLRALEDLYGQRPRTRLRAKAVEHALLALGAPRPDA